MTDDEVDALVARRAEIETRQIAAIGEAAGTLAKVRVENLKPMNQRLLWAEFEFYKALKVWDGSGTFDDTLNDICASLGVDDEGEETPADRSDYVDYLCDQRRDRQMEREFEAMGGEA